MAWQTILKQHNIEHFGVVPMSDVVYIYEHQRARIPEDAQSVIVVLVPYYVGHKRSIVAKYTMIPDYHRLVGAILGDICAALRAEYPADSFAPFCDISPIDEIGAAYRAGLGVVGRNGHIINDEYGSFVFIAEIFTSLALAPSEPLGLPCAGCGFCETHCPGHALHSGQLDKTHCASFISQKKGELSAEEIEIFLGAGLVFGCDTCQNICPHNRRIKKTPIKVFYDDLLLDFGEEDIPAIVDKYALGFRGQAVLRRNLALFRAHQKEEKA